MTRFENAVVVPAYNEQANIASTLNVLLKGQSLAPEAVVVVDSASTDDTVGIVERMQAENANLHLVSESRRGVGFSCNTGFRYAIDELGASIVSRTDADTHPSGSWHETILNYFARHEQKELVTGPTYPRHDDSYRYRDEVLWLVAQAGYRAVNVATLKSLLALKVVHGHNMAVRSRAFDEVGGFPDSSWAEGLENVELSKRIYEHYGFDALGYSFNMGVRTSMRRVRAVGYLGLVSRRGNLAVPISSYE